MTRWLLENYPEATVFPIAEEPLKRALSEAGIKISEEPEERPTYVLDRIDCLIPPQMWNELGWTDSK